ncbi:MAG TPA: hypothetical protein VGC79_37675 [Polyangiaceae bacterium]
MLKPHPKSLEIFGDPKLAPEYPTLLRSIRENGLLEPLVVNSNQEILSGTLRWTCLCELYGPRYSVTVFEKFFESKDAEVRYLIEVNVKRRIWSHRQIAAAFTTLKTLTPEQGGTKAPRGRPAKSSACGTFVERRKTDEEAAKKLGMGKHKARALETVFHTPGVPDEVKDAVDKQQVSPTRAEKVIKAHQAKDGTIADPDAISSALFEQPAPAVVPHTGRTRRKRGRAHGKIEGQLLHLMIAAGNVGASWQVKPFSEEQARSSVAQVQETLRLLTSELIRILGPAACESIFTGRDSTSHRTPGQ